MSWLRRIAIGRHPQRTLIRIAVLSLISIVTFGWLLTPVRVSGISMEPTYRDSTLNLVNRLVFRIRAPDGATKGIFGTVSGYPAARVYHRENMTTIAPRIRLLGLLPVVTLVTVAVDAEWESRCA